MRAGVVGAGGAIGGHLVARLLADGHDVVASDIKADRDWWQHHGGADNRELDVRNESEAWLAVAGCDWVFNLAADMGGMGYLHYHQADVMHSNLLISLHVLDAARRCGSRYLETSSACVYPEGLQVMPNIAGLMEEDAYPANPDLAYGWAKLMGERLASYYAADYGMEVRLPRLHNVMGTYGSWTGGREKVPAAICRKVAQAKLTGDHRIGVWGDGQQTRSFCWVGDCVEGLMRLMASDFSEPLNIGSSEQVSIDTLLETVSEIADVAVDPVYDLSAPQGVRGRSSDNTLCRQVLGWEPSTSLRDGLAVLYPWVEAQVKATM